jgi:hypothetical protein
MATVVVEQEHQHHDGDDSVRDTFYLVVFVSFLGRLPGECELVVRAWKDGTDHYRLAFQSLQLLVQICAFAWALLFRRSCLEKTHRVVLASGVSVLMRIYMDAIENCMKWYVGESPFTATMGVFVIACLWISTLSYWIYKKPN